MTNLGNPSGFPGPSDEAGSNLAGSPTPERAPSVEGCRIWFDTEFIEDGKTIDLISIGLVREDGATYYAECGEADLTRADEWVRVNVLRHLTGPRKTRSRIASEIVEFVGPRPELWAYYADYDWVALCQLYGRMTDLPKGWPMFCRDLKQLAVSLGNPALPKQEGAEHNSLADALWNRTVHAALLAAVRPTDAGAVPQPVAFDDAAIKGMVDRFLSWRLPENFQPDGGISFRPTFNIHMPQPTRNEPTGTNLFDAEQATAMVRHMVGPLYAAPPAPKDAAPAPDEMALELLADVQTVLRSQNE